MNPTLIEVTRSLFNESKMIFWLALPPAFLFSILLMYVSGEITGGKLEVLFKRVVIAITLIIAFPQISSLFSNLEASLVYHFGGEESIKSIFDKVTEHINSVSSTGALGWVKIGQYFLTFISTISFLILAIVKKLLDIIHLTLWNLLHVLGPMALIGCMFQNFQGAAKGVFMGLFELSLWKPVWVVIGRLLIAIGFGDAPTTSEDWLNSAIMNFAVAGLMIGTPLIVHAFITGSIGAIGSQLIQTMSGGMSAAVLSQPITRFKSVIEGAKNKTANVFRPSRTKHFTQNKKSDSTLKNKN